MIILGLTGSIGMGKSTTARLFREEGIPVNDADEVVHRLYAGAAAPLIGQAFSGTVVDGVVNRALLSAQLAENPNRFAELEAIVHPLVRHAEEEFVRGEREAGSRLIVLDIPLLFEVKAESRVDKIVVVTCAPEIQRRRVLERPGMTAAKFELILARQMPDVEKRRRADFIVDTGHGIEHARSQVMKIITELVPPDAMRTDPNA